MQLSYQNIFTPGADREVIEAEITTNHPASSYGHPVIVLEDGSSLDMTSWVCMSYQVVDASPAEFANLKKIGIE